MIVCPSCQHRNAPNALYCAACGASMENYVHRVCPDCGALNEAQNLYCHNCLSELIPPAQVVAEDETDRSLPSLPSDDSSAADTSESSPDEGDLALKVLPQTDHGAIAIEPKATQEDLTEHDLVPEFLSGEDVVELPSPPMQELDVGGDELAWLRTTSDEATAETEPDELPVVEPAEPAKALVDALDADAPEATEGAEHPESLEIELDDVPPGEAQDESISLASAEEQLVRHQVLAPLEELDRGIPIETAVALPHRAAARSLRSPEEVERRDASLFKQIATEPASLAVPAHTLLPSQGRGLSRWGQVLLNLLVLAAVVLPYFTDGMTRYWVTPRPQVAAAADALNSLPTEGKVLIAFDYTPTYAGELDPMAAAILRQLVRQSVKIVALSTQPGGVGIAERVLEQAAQEADDYVYGQDYVILGYLAAQEAGLRALGNPLATVFKVNPLQPEDDVASLDVMTDVFDLDDLDQVIVFAEDSQDVRHWVEQVQSRTGCTLHAVVTTRIAPLLMPYKQSGQLATLLGAADSVAEYEIASGVQRASLAQVDGHAVLILLIALIAVLANVIYVSRGSRREAKTRSE